MNKKLPEITYVLAEDSHDAQERINRAYSVLFEHTFRKLQNKKLENNEKIA